MAAYQARQRYGQVLVSVTIGPQQLAALEKLALLERGERDKEAIGWAIERFLDAAPHLSAMGDSLWPADEDDGV
jgi:hypothetical protein